jgi:hypothetical protein
MKKLVWMFALLAACESVDPTELLVVVDSDLAVPGALDEVRVEVTGVEDMVARGSLEEEGLPRTVGVVYAGGSLGPVRVRAVGSVGGTDVVEALAITSFVEGRTLILPMFLSARCRDVACDADMTCAAGNCTGAVIDASTLVEWMGEVPRLDGGSCPSSAETCNEMDDDCDGEVDEDFDLASDPNHCGACGQTCELPNATSACRGGCDLEACNDGFGNCDGSDSNGCELDVRTSLTDCGECGSPCAFPNASATCTDGTCAFGACNPGFGDCDGNQANGCETLTTTAADCGTCGNLCEFDNAAGDCSTGLCALGMCALGFDDCNGMASDGCEAAVDTLSDCGMCGVACDVANGTPTCSTGLCDVASCDTGFDDCTGGAADGCETPLNTLTDCGSCGGPCVRQNATATCATGACRIGTCNTGFDNCDGMDANGCEDAITDVSDCGACNVTCNLFATNMHACNMGTCEVVTCDTGRGNCDGNHANGCETDLTTDTNCGMCGRACTGGQRCRTSPAPTSCR